MRHAVAKKLIVYLLVLSAVVAILGTAFQVFVDYTKDKENINSILRHIEVSYVPSIVNSLWILDEPALRLQLEGILNYPEIVFLEIRHDGMESISVGIRQTESVMIKEFPLRFSDEGDWLGLGKLTVVVSLKNIYQRQLERSLIILLTETIKISVITIFIFVFFYFLVGRHLETMAEYTQGLDYQNLRMPLMLRKRKVKSDGEEDELDQLAKAINNMRINLSDSFAKMFKYQEELTSINQQLLTTDVELRVKQKELEGTLKEKTVLLQEVHHRVKNNMQVIASIINLQAAKLDDKEMLKVFNDLRSRIHSMASVHEQLYRAERFSEIDFSDYIKNICNYLLRLYSISAGRIQMDVNVEDISIGIDQAVPCALILNELISNALKYAYPEDRKGILYISFSFDEITEIYHLQIRDDGVGIPKEFEERKGGSLGMTLVNALVKQLYGTLDIANDNGSMFTIEFPLKKQSVIKNR